MLKVLCPASVRMELVTKAVVAHQPNRLPPQDVINSDPSSTNIFNVQLDQLTVYTVSRS